MTMTRFTSLILAHFILSSFTPASGNNNKPGKISNVGNISTTDDCDSIYISWEPPTEDIKSYHVYIHVHQDNLTINGKPYKPGIFYSTSLTEINVTNLLREVAYKFNISAINSKGISGEARIMNITVIPIEKIIQHLLMSNKMVASIVIGGTVVVFGVPLGIKWLGFTVAGVAAKSIAAWLMSILGPIGAGSLYATLQSVGVLGLSYAAKVLLFLLGGTIGGSLSSIFGLTYIFFKNCVLEVDPDI